MLLRGKICLRQWARSSVKVHSRVGESRGVKPLWAMAGIGGDDRMVAVYDAKTFEVRWPLRGHNRWVESVWNEDGRDTLASVGDDDTVDIVDNS